MESLNGLNFYGGGVRLDRLRFTTKNGITADFSALQLANPLGAFGATNDSELTIGKAELYFPELRPPPGSGESGEQRESGTTNGQTDTAKHAAATSQSSRQEDKRRSDTGPLYLSALIDSLASVPARIEIQQLEWPQADQSWHSATARLSVRRLPDSTTLLTKYVTSRLRAEATIIPDRERLQLRGKVNLGDAPASQVLIATAERRPDESWQTAISTVARLQWLQSGELPLPVETSSGELIAKLSGILPDDLRALDEYKNLWVNLSSQKASVTLDRDFAPLTLKMETTEPLSAQISSVSPLQLRQLSGEAQVDADLTGKTMAQLLSANIRAQGTGGKPVLKASGTVFPQQLHALLQETALKKRPDLAAIESTTGTLLFAMHAQLAGPGENLAISANDHLLVHEASLELKSGSELRLVTGPDPAGKSVLNQLGWKQISAKVDLEAPVILSTDGWPGDIHLSAPDLRGTLQGVTLQKKGGKEATPVLFQVTDASCQFSDTPNCSVVARTEAAELALAEPEATLIDLQLSTSVNVKHTKSGNKIKLSKFAAEAERLSSGEVQIEGLSLNSPSFECVAEETEIRCEGESTATALSAGSANPAVNVGGTLSFPSLVFTHRDREPKLNASFQIPGGKLRWVNSGQTDFTGSGDLSLEGGKLRGKGQISAGDLQVRGSWSHNLDSSSGEAKLGMPRVSFSKERPLSHSARGLPVDIVAGSLAGTAQFAWPAGEQDQIQLSLDEIAGVYEKSFATGISTTLKLQRSGGFWRTPEPQPVSVSSVDVGVSITDIRFDLKVTEERDIILSSLSAATLGGEISSKSLSWNLDNEPRRSLVSANGISLRALENEMEAENFAASGTLDLQIPVVTGPDGITVENGEVEARAPGGRLRYYGAFSPQMLAGNPQLKMLSGALEDYNFRTLGGTLNYPPSGDMQLKLKLVGRSDSVAKDRDLIINLNLENNIPSMLRSLQASRDLSEALQKRLE
ncbi:MULTISPECIES: YdbH domain-containing protein [Microbulbifer]|uniref:intermembrane phospholipid transport protein YdbH family protein n=1 Tax=Microbulbifer TaxID=48073 RepID=UPI001144F467|nr:MULTISPECIES: YdbH domain-containing protein [Microbulbifer]